MDEELTLSTSLPWELGKSLIKQESAAKPQDRCQVGKGGAEGLPAAGGPEVARRPGQGAEGLTSQSFLRSCRLPFSLTPQPPPCLVTVARGNRLAQGPVPHAPFSQWNVPLYGLSTRLSQARLPRQQSGVA